MSENLVQYWDIGYFCEMDSSPKIYQLFLTNDMKTSYQHEKELIRKLMYEFRERQYSIEELKSLKCFYERKLDEMRSGIGSENTLINTTIALIAICVAIMSILKEYYLILPYVMTCLLTFSGVILLCTQLNQHKRYRKAGWKLKVCIYVIENLLNE